MTNPQTAPRHDTLDNAGRRNLLRLGSGATLASLLAPGALWASGIEAANAGRQISYLSGFYKPTQVESTSLGLKVRGNIPAELSGRYFRNGHNPKAGAKPAFWFAGDGMVFGVRIRNGKAEWYRNRWVDTPALHGAPLFRPDRSIDFAASAAATSIVAHAGRILALQEVNFPYEMTPELETVGAYTFGGALKSNMTAHPKIDPQTGEMLFFGASPVPPHLVFHQVDRHGQLAHSEIIEGAGPSVMHDFMITKNYVIFFDTSVTFNPRASLPFPYAWNPKYQAKIGLLPRDRSKGPVRWIPMDPFYTFHQSNAWEDASGRIVVQGTQWDQAAWEHTSMWINSVAGHGQWPGKGMHMAQWTIDPVQATASVKVVDDLSTDFPTINAALLTSASRYTYAVAFPNTKLKQPALVKYDSRTGQRQVREFPSGQMPSEPNFAAAAGATGEDNGWILSLVSDLASQRGHLLILDAHDIRKPPVAVIDIPDWVSAGVHGAWISDKELAPS
ncbi:MAG: carotenoid oxygenase family protein [Polaromonas sp.]|nr:carotenoid oxygenase family protein [Polaromonas sp.]